VSRRISKHKPPQRGQTICASNQPLQRKAIIITASHADGLLSSPKLISVAIPLVRREIEQAFVVLDAAFAEATLEHQGEWTLTLCRHAAVLAHAKGGLDREIEYTKHEIEYTKQALPHAKDCRFAADHFAQLLLRDGQVDLAQR
jgi:hypothetical protein